MKFKKILVYYFTRDITKNVQKSRRTCALKKILYHDGLESLRKSSTRNVTNFLIKTACGANQGLRWIIINEIEHIEEIANPLVPSVWGETGSQSLALSDSFYKTKKV